MKVNNLGMFLKSLFSSKMIGENRVVKLTMSVNYDGRKIRTTIRAPVSIPSLIFIINIDADKCKTFMQLYICTYV